MARGITKSKTNAVSKAVVTIHCVCCKQDWKETEYYSTSSLIYKDKIPICKSCIEGLYKQYYKKYRDEGRKKPEQDAIRRICMMADIYYSDAVFNAAIKKTDNVQKNTTIIAAYLQLVRMNQYSKRTYDKTIEEENKFEIPVEIDDDDDADIDSKTIRFFGKGFSTEDYVFLQEQYKDWTARHECNTKSQEEVFKQICFTQLKLLKAEQRGEETKDLNATFLKQLEAAKLQPKQNKSETTSEVQSFGTLIEKWEDTRPIPDVDPTLKDVDKIGMYLDVFFRGHLAKMMGLKNGISRLYEQFMEKYSVKKPEHSEESESEAVFDAIFGNPALMDDN